MEILAIIQVFTQALKTHSKKFELIDLQDLDQLLATLETPTEAELDQILTNWLQTHTEVRDTLRRFDDQRELKNSPKLPSNSEAGILENLFELRQTNQEIIKAKTNQQQPDKSKQ
ncbi:MULTISPECIES: hypothetical protein [unclassified Moorena]|uniref:hypothetical protein n=1 Tax=unclassified Moorena TaxID=2683338 RepID=UPI0014016F19|nr:MULTISPECIES: hypothetical protein [unclassified Moorena]NEO11534.1 hypothetical protein [Moorena sp. SIO3E8]NEP97994.1 hypothetical protein [Moorena sp. SIO3F7]